MRCTPPSWTASPLCNGSGFEATAVRAIGYASSAQHSTVSLSLLKPADQICGRLSLLTVSCDSGMKVQSGGHACCARAVMHVYTFPSMNSCALEDSE